MDLKLDLKPKRVFIAFLFMFAAYVFMQYHTYLGSIGLGNFGISEIRPSTVRKGLRFGIFAIFTFIFSSSIKSEGVLKRIFILLIAGLIFSLIDEGRDYVTGFEPSIGDVMMDMKGTLSSTVCIVLLSKQKNLMRSGI